MALDHSSAAALGAAIRPLPSRLRQFDLGRALPSGRSLVVGFGLVTLAVAAYAGARTTSVFAIERIEVRGLPAADAAAARKALAPLQGKSLVSLRRTELEQRLATLPGLLGFEYDRAFPHTIVVMATPELSTAVLRRGADSWLVSRRGRVLRRVARGAQPGLPRIWVRESTDVSAGGTLAGEAGTSAWALAVLQQAQFPRPVRTVRTRGELTYVLRSGLEIRLGTARDAVLKLAIARQIVPRLAADFRYLDVSAPERPVAGTTLNPKVEVDG